MERKEYFFIMMCKEREVVRIDHDVEGKRVCVRCLIMMWMRIVLGKV